MYKYFNVIVIMFYSMVCSAIAVEVELTPSQRLIIYLTDSAGKVLQDKDLRNKKIFYWSQSTGLELTLVLKRSATSWVIAITPKMDTSQITDLIRF